MAEKGAYLTGTAFTKPSIFEIIAQESFASTVEPAFKKILSFIVSFNHGRYEHVLKWADECYLIFNVILQRYYLKKHSASFSEAFYSLKRIAIENSSNQRELSKQQKGISLILLVLFPYLKNKFFQLSQRYKLEKIDGYLPQTKWEKLYRIFIVKGYTVTFMLYEFMVLYNYVLYISGKSVFTSPLLRLLSISLTYTEPKMVISVSDLLRKIKNNSFGISDGLDIFQRVVTTSLEFGAFFLQFLSWWNQEHYFTNLMSLPVPPPPVIPEIAKKYKGMCPICCKTPRVHTVLSVSGYAFCYQCILSVIRKSGKCPVTNYPAKEDDLIRLYLD
ncbi:peroxisomal biogenesis factor 12 [Osmia lignaria lignaria]|uniref:peroxisomal biogenesis factor 12 n=1 Tax=Osmia lignaria lignaria TaxID=1437193 RepID=UPI0014788FBF|nr:peroxisome assembly protein 12 [Osmia lignaria]XP_034190375.1 peroxisome assembly protein 12 [Osmia lignaria]XP_034190376.1 peroxisome assembly protein 12 [Osmia lignaria]XP_034190377.1 peroxisome assembly protein 12 [Osmia lignaria]XP_034190378.1 peroxisome assembly protein 12 [Osmia lignaria]XP_034190379.1 peroxisome assembly protein 12 [Osmia lignaria]